MNTLNEKYQLLNYIPPCIPCGLYCTQLIGNDGFSLSDLTTIINIIMRKTFGIPIIVESKLGYLYETSKYGKRTWIHITWLHVCMCAYNRCVSVHALLQKTIPELFFIRMNWEATFSENFLSNHKLQPICVGNNSKIWTINRYQSILQKLIDKLTRSTRWLKLLNFLLNSATRAIAVVWLLFSWASSSVSI